MKNLKEMNNEELLELEKKYMEAHKAIFQDIGKFTKDSPEYNLLKSDFDKVEQKLSEIEKEKKSRKENNIIKSEETKDDEEINIEEYKKTYAELLEELKETKKIGIPKTLLILGAEIFVSKLFWMKAPTVFALLVTGASIVHIVKRISKRITYEKIKSDARYLRKEIEKHEKPNKKKKNIFSKAKGFIKLSIPSKVKNIFKSIKSKVEKEDLIEEKNNINSSEENIEQPQIKIENQKEKSNNDKIEELKQAKQEIIDGVYGLKKDQIIQDRVNVREICEFYGTNNTNPSYTKTSKEKVMVKNKVA